MLCAFAVWAAAVGQFDVKAEAGLIAGFGYFTNLVGAFGNLMELAPETRPMWTLGIEEQFYLLWPLLLFVVLRGSVRWGIAVASLMLAATVVQSWRLAHELDRVYMGPDTATLPIAAGCLTALVLWARPGWYAAASRLAWPAALAVLALLIWPRDMSSYHGPLLAFALASCALVAACWYGHGPIPRALSWQPARFLGRISYSVYLWNVLIIGVIAHVGIGGRAEQASAVALTVVVSAASYRWVEQPFRRRRIERRPALESATSAA